MKVRSFLSNIKYSFLNIFDDFKSFIEKITNIVQYVIFLWKTNSWLDCDGLSILDLLAFKLERMKKVIEDEQLYEGWEKDAKDIDDTIAFLDMWRNADEYLVQPTALTRELNEMINNLEVSTERTEQESAEIKAYFEKFPFLKNILRKYYIFFGL